LFDAASVRDADDGGVDAADGARADGTGPAPDAGGDAPGDGDGSPHPLLDAGEPDGDSGLPPSGDGSSQSCSTTGPGRTDCGPDAGENCCETLLVVGGTFDRSFDADGGSYVDGGATTTVSSFRLDRFEVTLGRFRPFIAAVEAGWVPPQGSGIHAHLAGGKGLAVAPGGGYELGWDASWLQYLPTGADAGADWNQRLNCDVGQESWTATPGAWEERPVECVTWYDAYAFCIWDGGFLPSEAEWN
jgi:hypothetical protein